MSIPSVLTAVMTATKIGMIGWFNQTPRKKVARGTAASIAQAGTHNLRGFATTSSRNAPKPGATKNHAMTNGRNVASILKPAVVSSL